MMSLGGKGLLVAGVGATGKAVAKAGDVLGARVFVCDDTPEKLENALAELAPLGVSALSREEVLTSEFDLCVASPGIPPTHELLRSLERRGVPVISEIELAWQLSKAPVAAITGTNGKSTTTVLAGKMMEAAGRKTYIGGNLSAEGYDLPLISAALEAQSGDVLVAEVSSFQLERCYQFRPVVAALLNITPDHCNRYDSLEDYAQAKMRMFQAQSPADVAVLGWDDDLVRRLSEQIPSRKLWFSSQSEVAEGAFLRGEELILRTHSQEKTIALTSEMKMWAQYDWKNTLAAACIACGIGAPIEAARTVAVSFEGLPHRMEDCGSIGGVRWFNNSMCTNPAAGSNAVQAVAREFPTIVIAGGAQKGLDYADWGCDVARAAKALILIGQDSGILAEAANQAGMRDVRKVADLKAAMELARTKAQPGDAVLMAPAMASFDSFTNFRERGQKFKEICESFRTEANSV
ncbi:MAG: UDP-N-acetylmuramoyl-L-alanine--D-glutamate ligase [Armatimonadetes bacterium]|nr:UDP-N-acetylmuramoyl-L-alanine--D-glutamate ligase [Armatimonadota bacterium]